MRNAIAVVVFVTLLPAAAFGAESSLTAATAVTPNERAQFWREALERFRAERPDHSARVWLAVATPVGPTYCNCYSDSCCTSGASCQKNGGCVSWDSESGKRYDGLCIRADATDPQ